MVAIYFIVLITDADFYLINPAGIVFGEGSELNVQGSFYASWADYLRLGINGKFNATHPHDSYLSAPKIVIRGEKFWVKNSVINTSSFTDQDAGDIIIDTVDFLMEADAWISADSYGSGKAGNVRIETSQFQMTGETQITAANNVGNITIIADYIKMADDATINTMSYSNNAGNIKINSNKLSMTDKAWIYNNTFVFLWVQMIFMLVSVRIC